MKENGKMIKQLAKESTFIIMELFLKEIGLKIANTDREKRSEEMVLNMKENIIMDRRMEKENFIGKTALFIKANF